MFDFVRLLTGKKASPEKVDNEITILTVSSKKADQIYREIDQVQTRWFMLVGRGDKIDSHTLSKIAALLKKQDDFFMVYGDETIVTDEGEKKIFRKPGWSPDLMLSIDYIGRTAIYRTDKAREIFSSEDMHEISSGRTGLWWFSLRYLQHCGCFEKADKAMIHSFLNSDSECGVRAGVVHVCSLFLDSKRKDYSSYDIQNEAAALKDAASFITRDNFRTDVEAVEKASAEHIRLHQIPENQAAFSGGYRLTYIKAKSDLVSIIIPSKDNFDLLQQCICSAADTSEPRNAEFVIVDNGSGGSCREKTEEVLERLNQRGFRTSYIYTPMEFNFSKMCNIGAEEAAGNLLLFMNDDIKVNDNSWLGRLAGQAGMRWTGAVGARLRYPDSRTIQHIGITNLLDGPVHNCIHRSDDECWYFGRNRLIYNYLAVTGACLMVDAAKYHAVEGMDEKLGVAYNDVDLCMKLYEMGWYNCVREDVCMYHYESVSRGQDAMDAAKISRLNRERAYLYKKHSLNAGEDPFYNIHLDNKSDQFLLDDGLEIH